MKREKEKQDNDAEFDDDFLEELDMILEDD